MKMDLPKKIQNSLTQPKVNKIILNKFLKIGQSKTDFIIDTTLYSIINLFLGYNLMG